MKFWALLSLLALCHAKPSHLSGAPSQLYNTPNVAPPQVPGPSSPPFVPGPSSPPFVPGPSSPPFVPGPSSPPANTYVPPGPLPSFPGNFFDPSQQQQEQQFPSSSGGQEQSFNFPEQPQQVYETPQEPAPGPVNCPEGQVDKGDGTCATPQITRNLFLYRVPDDEFAHGEAPVLPDPKVHYNFVFIRTADQAAGLQPLVAPAPQQKTLVYVLNKKQEEEAQRVIQQESKPTKPEVYFVSYKDGENLDLPGGVDLQTALSQSLLQGEVVENPGDVFTPTDDVTTTGPKGYNYNSP